jgi:hypothetical protein
MTGSLTVATFKLVVVVVGLGGMVNLSFIIAAQT